VRLVSLHQRLVTWWLAGPHEGSELKEVWEDALRRFDRTLRAYQAWYPDEAERLLETPADVVLRAFEDSLSDHENILAAFPIEPPEGWQEWPEGI
jgi:hypothetical protein